MARYEWFIDHADDIHSAVTEPVVPGFVRDDKYVTFKIRSDEDESVKYCTLTPKDARKLGKALIKAAKDAES